MDKIANFRTTVNLYGLVVFSMIAIIIVSFGYLEYMQVYNVQLVSTGAAPPPQQHITSPYYLLYVFAGLGAFITAFYIIHRKGWLIKFRSKKIALREIITYSMAISMAVVVISYSQIAYTLIILLAIPEYQKIFVLILIGSTIGMMYLSFKKYRRRHLNFFTGTIAVGYSVLLGMVLSPIIAMAILIGFSLYDIIAVFKMKIMQQMAYVALKPDEAPLPIAFVAGDMEAMNQRIEKFKHEGSGKYYCLNCFTTYEKVDDAFICPNCGRKITGEKDSKVIEAGSKEKTLNAMMLGSGDIIFPNVFLVSVLAVNPASFFWIGLALAILMGIALDMLISHRTGRGIPALPVISICMGVAALLMFLLGVVI